EDRSFSILLYVTESDIDTGGKFYRARGVFRIISGVGPSDFKSIVHMTRPSHWGAESLGKLVNQMDGAPWTKVWDIATMAVHPTVRAVGPKAILGMLHSLYLLSINRGVDFLVGVLADNAYNELDRVGLGLIALGDSKEYFGVSS